MITNRRLLGSLWRCGLDDCLCTQPVIDEEWWEIEDNLLPLRKSLYRTERVWEGTFVSDPSPMVLGDLAEELAEACRRHNMEEDPSWGEWSREI